MKELFFMIAAFCLIIAVQSCQKANAQQLSQPASTITSSDEIGLPCATYGQTRLSFIATQGVMECIPDGSGNLFWQPMGGTARYDTSATCTVAGMLRWNGSSIQYCNGSTWASLGGGSVGKLNWDGAWWGNNFWCDPGYSLVYFHYDCGCHNNATWFECQAQ